MRVHPRESLANLASAKVAVAMLKIWDKHDLTYETILTTLTGVQTHYLWQIAIAEGARSDLLSNPNGMHMPEEAMAMEIRAVIDQQVLTPGEILRCLNEQMASAIKYVIREERHPGKPDMPGGLEAPRRMQP